LIKLKRDHEYAGSNESKGSFERRLQKAREQEFEEFARDLNEVFGQFGINVYLTRQGFMPSQEEKIIETIYRPVLSVLSDARWKEVNDLISFAFKEFEKKTPDGFSISITSTVAAVQAFLQLLVNGKSGKGDIGDLILIGQKTGKIPNDVFSQTIFKNINSILARERQQKGIAHPPQEIATEKNALVMLNIAMVFFQHCL
jgi:hypothetical protein